MNKMQKLNRTAVAAVLATSGIAVTAPYTVVKADSPFSDITTSNSHYDAIMQLYDRNIISGFEDGTFRASQTVTRGQAAKMLALVLGLDIKNVKNPKFKDVSTKSSYYPYIAALVEQDIISGYADNTYRPGEVITRNQMAKILVRGFQFSEASTLTHTFEDVSAKNANRFYIQTLVDLGITTGTSAITFSPSKAVTRGQLASFLIRAENANVLNSAVKEITKVEQISGKTYVYLNGVKHTVHSSLNDMLNVSNTEILRGAYIEGTIVGKEIRSLNKITFNAVGTANNMLTFNGNGTTFRGTVIITGNHLRFQNWTLTGELTIEEAKQQAVSNFVKPIALKTVASLQTVYDNIDWGTITPPSVTEPNETDGLVDIPTGPNQLPAMKNVAHNLVFENVEIRALVITANRTSIRSNQDLAHVTVAGFVREFELFTDVNELYIESDENVTFYGVSDIEKLYKNSYKSVNLYADSVTKLVTADNASGWIDLGDFYYIDKIIIPPKTLPYEIFNDFINDSDKIGQIEDPSGTEIERDPVGEIIIPDWEAPTLLVKNIQTHLATANITVNSNEDGTVHYLIKREIDGEPSIREIMQYTGSMGGNKAVSAGQDSVISVTNLKDEQKYIFYAVAVDEAGNISVKKSEAFEILDASAPVIDPVQIEGMPGGKRIKVTMRPNEPGEYFYYYEPMPMLGANVYTSTEILDFVARNYRGQTGKGKVLTAGQMNFQILNLEPLTSYVVYIVMRDEQGNTMVEPKVVSARTTELDDVYPYITDGELYPVNNDYYEFEVNVNEALDPVSANNINNYELSGTAIINIDGQPTTIKPDRVEYIAGQRKIKIRVPSATALVNGDTIVVRILPGVTDLAENEFVNVNVVDTVEELRDTAVYVHNDTVKPTLTINSFRPNALKTSGILTYRANKAGTYYYMIVPNSYDMGSVSPRDFYNEFTDEPTLPVTKRVPYLTKQGDNGANTVVVGTQNQTVNLPTSTDPFESYSLYMIMKDRSGQLSTIEKVEDIIDDSRAPFVRRLDVLPVEGTNTQVEITVDVSEEGRVYYKRFKKNTTDPDELVELAAIRNWDTLLKLNKGNHNTINDEDVREYVKTMRSWPTARLSLDDGTVTKIKDNVSPHTEYIYFFAVEDMYGNITMYPSQLSSPQVGTVEDYASTIMERTVYSDGINPTIIGNNLALANEIDIFNILPPSGSTSVGDGKLDYAPEKTFTITFSELLTYTGTTTPATKPIAYDPQTLARLKDVIDAKLPATTRVLDMEWEKDNANISTWNEHRLIFTVSGPLSSSIILQEEDFALFSDLAIRRITDDTKLEYLTKSPALNGIVGLGLNRATELGYAPATATLRASSRGIIVQLEMNDVVSRELRYYFVVQNDTATNVATAEQVVNYVKYQTSPNKMLLDNKFDIGGFDRNRMGSGVFDGEQTGGAFSQELIIPAPNVFFTGQKLYFVTTDKYGNIVGSNISSNSPGLIGGPNHAVITD